MNTMFFTEKPLGTISYEYVEDLRADMRINAVVPFTMGDSYNGAKIVGTEPLFLEGRALSDGEMFDAKFECVLGSAVAKKYGLTIGSELITSHGLAEGGHAHEQNPLKVVGILKQTNTSYDNVIFTSLESVWETHSHSDGEHADDHEEEHGEICAILIKSKSMNHYNQIKNEYSQNSKLLVITPSEVIREVMENVDMSSKIVYLLCVIILIMNIFIISIITLLNMHDSKKEISLMRLIGVGMNKINLLYIIQNGIIGLAATLLAFGLSRLCLALMGEFVASMGIVLNTAVIFPLEFAIMGIVFVISVLPTVICTFNMSRKDGIEE
jgi:ABC-type lipoprotein release transport system permease subunit